MKQYIVDAFADELFTGNPAAVLPCSLNPRSRMTVSAAIAPARYSVFSTVSMV